MSLVAGRGPFGSNRAGWFTPEVPASVVYIEPHPRRIQAFRDGTALIDTEQALMVHRGGHPLSYAFPSGSTSDLPTEPVAEAPGSVRVPWDAVGTWLEEGRRLVHYPPNPYHRVDCRPTQRHLAVMVADVMLVDTEDTVIVFETSLAPRLYVAPTHVRTDLLRRSPTSSYCNYKGEATNWSATRSSRMSRGATTIRCPSRYPSRGTSVLTPPGCRYWPTYRMPKANPAAARSESYLAAE